MRHFLASLAVVAAVAFAVPAFAQETQATPAAPTPAAKPKPGTTAYCNTLKTSTSRSACLKRVHAQATPKAAPATAAPKAKPKKLEPAASAMPKTDNSAQLAPPAATPAPPQTIAVPPLPQKTI
jgi:hypothetical protein